VRDYHIRVNREINIPDTDYVNEFLRTRKTKFD